MPLVNGRIVEFKLVPFRSNKIISWSLSNRSNESETAVMFSLSTSVKDKVLATIGTGMIVR